MLAETPAPPLQAIRTPNMRLGTINARIADGVRSYERQAVAVLVGAIHGRPCMAGRLCGRRAVLAETPAPPLQA
ncbi:MAG: hypothetical protein Q8M64_08075, partial [Methyloversatilis sp.]|nr:hypothetical protein [Methyloversatilis sp.]